MRLSDRLEAIISMIPPCETAADIGTDHGFVPIELVRRKITERAIASDVRRGPLERAEAHVREASLSDRIDVRLGSGLSTLSAGEADAVIIAGMGGMLMIRLLTEGSAVLKSTKTLVLSPHTDVPEVRQYAASHGFSIDDEDMVEEDGKFYVIMRCGNRFFSDENDSDRAKPLSQLEALFGPVLLKKMPEAFRLFIDQEFIKTTALLEQFQKKDIRGEIVAEKERYRDLLYRVKKIMP